MRKLSRAAEPTILSGNEANWVDKLRAARRTRDRKAFLQAQEKYKNSTIKNALDSFHYGKCAYCESHVHHVAPMHIEHFRPKSRFLSLTFNWHNLLLSCPACNSPSYKGAHFPNQLQGGPILDPCIDDPNEHFQFLWDHQTSLAVVKSKTSRGATTERILGLNRIALLKARSNYIKAIFLAMTYADSDALAKSIVDDALAAMGQYQAFVGKLLP